VRGTEARSDASHEPVNRVMCDFAGCWSFCMPGEEGRQGLLKRNFLVYFGLDHPEIRQSRSNGLWSHQYDALPGWIGFHGVVERVVDRQQAAHAENGQRPGHCAARRDDDPQDGPGDVSVVPGDEEHPHAG
jgi:hypothetical protein